MTSDRLKIGDRVREISTDRVGTLMAHLGPEFVEVTWDEPHPTRWADGSPATTWCSCMHAGLLSPAAQDVLP